MGNNTSCNNLQEYSDVCEMHNCIDNVEGIASNSTSPTDTWIVRFKPGTKYEGKVVDSGFVKWFINPYSLPNPRDTRQQSYIDTLKGLNYEVRIYRDIIRPLVDQNICSNFVRYYGSSENCGIGQMIKMLAGKADINNDPAFGKMPVNKAGYNITRSLIYMANGISDRPSINSAVGTPDINTIDTVYGNAGVLAGTTYNLLVNEPIKAGTITISEWLRGKYSKNSTTPFSQNTWRVIFQVMAGCYSMSLCKMTHNDLHLNNIWVEDLGSIKTYYYGLEDAIYKVDTHHKAMIYDFDRAYVERFGNNSLLADDDYFYCDQNSQCNQFIPNKDMVKFFAYLIRYKGARDHILDILAPNITARNWLESLYSSSMAVFLVKPDGQTATAQELNMLRSPIDILKEVGKLFSPGLVNQIPLNINPDDVFLCNPNMFDINGKIIVQKKFTETITRRKLSDCTDELQPLKQQTAMLSEHIRNQAGREQLLVAERDQLLIKVQELGKEVGDEMKKSLVEAQQQIDELKRNKAWLKKENKNLRRKIEEMQQGITPMDIE